MGSDDDIAASLPRPPLPAPARREAAIDEALRRFDGGGARPPVAVGGNRTARPAPWRPLSGRPWAGALAGAFLVALIALPIAWMSLDRHSMTGGTAPAPGVVEPSALPAADSNAADISDAAVPAPEQPVPPPPRVAEPTSEVRATKQVDQAPAPVEAAEPAPPPPPPPPLAEVAVKPAQPARMADARADEPRAFAGSNIVVTGSRARSPAAVAAPAAPSAGVPESAIVVSGTRIQRRSPARGDWNACTVDDPGRSLERCRKLVDRAQKGEAGRASGPMGDGLSKAWEGDVEGAIRAFDRAVEAAPRSSAAYLNRGLAYRRSGDLDHALADLDRAVRYAPASARAYYNRSLVLRQLGDTRRARADEQRAAELDRRYDRLMD
jgi:hypothetical protein